MTNEIEITLRKLIDGEFASNRKKLPSGLFLSYKLPDPTVPDTVRMHRLILGRIGAYNPGRGRLLVYPSPTDVRIIENILVGRWELEGVVIGEQYQFKSIHPRTEEKLVFGCQDVYWPVAQPLHLFET